MSVKPHVRAQRHNEACRPQPVLHGLLDEARHRERNNSDMQQLKWWLNSKYDPLLKVVSSYSKNFRSRSWQLADMTCHIVTD